jgi:SAM-dependent methyltransferase
MAPTDGHEGGFNVDAFQQLAALEVGNFWFESRNRLILWALERYFPAASSFLELGCGTGFVLAGLRAAHPGLSITGVELFPEGLSIARQRVPDASFFLGDARTYRPTDDFDVVGAFDVLEHIDDDLAALDRMRAATTEGGGILITVPQHPQLWSQSDAYACHVRRYRRSELVHRVEFSGFEVLRATSFVSVLLPAMLLSRLRGRHLEALDPLAELRLPRFLNSCLRTSLDFERLLIRHGVSWPAGGSLLLVGRRI